MKLGNAIANVATPIARTLGLPCIDPATNQLRPESRCNQNRQSLNDFSDAIFDRFWNNNKKEKKTMDEEMQFQIVIAIKAKSVEDALARKNEGTVLSVNPRPQPPPRPAPSLMGK